MRAFSQHPCFRLMVMALVAGAVVWGASLSAGAQEDPSGSPTVAPMWQGEQYLSSPVNPKSTESKQGDYGLPVESKLTGQPGQYVKRFYYSDPDHTHQVGYCISGSPCTYPRCTGRKTSFVEVIFSSCSGF
jgi:hypothetical protein